MVNNRSIEDSDNQSGALIGSNNDLLTEIFLWLPVISILRFKTVSKHWRSLLSDKHFTHQYDNNNNNNNNNNLSKTPGIFASNIYVPFDVENRSTPPFRTLDFCYDSNGIRIVQSCNRLLLCCSHHGDIGVRKYYVFNPTTKQFAIIPPVLGGQSVRRTICFMGLAFHPTDCVCYKLVCIRSLKRRGDLFQIQIYSSETCKWKISIESFSPAGAKFRNGVYWNGALHWALSYRSHLYFKIDVEQLQALPLPKEMISSNIVTMFLGESRGHLHLIVGHYRHEDRILNVYEMLNDYSGWFVKYQVDLFEFLDAFPEMKCTFGYSADIIDVVRGEEEDTFVVLEIRKKIITYNVHDKSFKQIFRLPDDFYGEHSVQLDELPEAFPEMVRNAYGSYYFNVIDVVRGEKEENTFLVLKILRKIIKYNVYDKSFKKIFSLGWGPSFGWGEAHHHVATVSAF